MFKFTIYTCHAPLPSLALMRQTYPVAGPLTPLQTPNNAPSLIARLMLAKLRTKAMPRLAPPFIFIAYSRFA